MKNFYKHLMSGVSYFLPFVVAGGILLAFAFILDAGNAGTETFGASTTVTAWLLEIGVLGMSMMLPIMAAFIAYSIADRPAIVVGMITGLMTDSAEAGFLGAIAAGFISGYVVLLLKKLVANMPRSLEGIKTMIIYPLGGLLIAGLIVTGVNQIVVPINTGLDNFMVNLSGTNAILLGAIAGAMLAIDLGGPINKAAYLFAVASLTGADGVATATVIMASVGSSAMVVSTSCAVAATLFPKKFEPHLRDAKVSAYVMGLSFFVEGAIPYVLTKPKQILPALCIGAAITGAITAAFGITLSAPLGGVATLPLVSNIPMYLLSFVIGTAVAVGIIALLLKDIPEDEMEEG